MQKYGALKLVAVALKVVAWLELAFGVGSIIYLAVKMWDVFSEASLGWIPAEGWLIYTAIIIGSLIATFAWFLLLLAASGCIYVFIDTERNTQFLEPTAEKELS